MTDTHRNASAFRTVTVLLFFLFQITVIQAASVSSRGVVGIVYDSTTGERLPMVTVCTSNNKNCITTDTLGVFRMRSKAVKSIYVRSEGYEIQKITLKGASDTLKIALVPKVTDLAEFIVKPKKWKYSKKNNPAVDLMRRVRADRDKIDPSEIKGYNYDVYEKVVVGLYGFDQGHTINFMPVKDRKKLMSLVDTAIWTGDRVMDLAIKEKSGVHVYENGRKIEIETAHRNDGLDKHFSEQYTNVFLNDVMSEADIYGNDIKLVRNTFVSPLSRIGADFYKYEITDTVRIGDEMCTELSFAPHSPEMTGFNGKLYIPVGDSIKYVRRAMLRLPKSANVNYIKGMVISQNFRLDSIGKLHKTLDDLVLNVQIAPKTPVFYFTRQSRHVGFNYSGRDEFKEYIDRIGNMFAVSDSENNDEAYWNEVRLIPLSMAEANLFDTNSVFNTDKGFWWFRKCLAIVVKGYIMTGSNETSKFDIGPLDSFVSYTKACGWRFQLGGTTTANFLPHLFLSGHVAYSIGDHRWKGAATLEYSLEKRKYVAGEFPMNNFRVSWSYDVDQIGAGSSWGYDGSILNSWRRVDNDYITYRHKISAEYIKEWRNHLMLRGGVNYIRQQESPYVKFENGLGVRYSHFGQAAINLTLRWAPGEKTIQGYTSRSRVNRDALVLTLSQDYGWKGLFGSMFNYSMTSLTIDKVFWFSAFGYADIRIRGAKLWTQVPFTALLWQDANTSYMMKNDSYNLLNPMEFALDQFAGWNLEYHANGLLLNRIPLIKKLKLREVIGFKGFVGSLTKKNNPEYSDGAFKFPDPATQPMGSTPYMECSAGLENVLTFLRVDYIWRLTYRNKPGISHGGLRVSFNFTF